MSDETWELERAATRFREQAARARSQAAIVRATVDLTWRGPGAESYRDLAVQRWAGLLRVADSMDRLADQLGRLASVVEAA